jgi:hypothetical protein
MHRLFVRATLKRQRDFSLVGVPDALQTACPAALCCNIDAAIMLQKFPIIALPAATA